MPNNLQNENSPYLLQHSDNPVNWYPWSEIPFDIAKKLDRPVFLSIGYSSCHWCHVMEEESFTDLDTALYLNENFVSIKVDREERPDIDSIYMEALQALSGSGGWPASLFLTPDKIPFFAGTYFPLIQRGNHPNFMSVLHSIVEHYKNKQETIFEIGDQIKQMLNTNLKNGSHNIDIENILESIKTSFDKENGGFHSAPKFPQPSILEFLIFLKNNHLLYSKFISNKDIDEMIVKSLYMMATGGIYDQLGGGFHRYTVDSKWVTPHFEKMLYDNALLSSIYTKSYDFYKYNWLNFVSDDVLKYLITEMSEKNKGFFSAEDADSEGKEGKFYVWESSEFNNILDCKEIKLAKNIFNISDKGNFEGKNILTGGYPNKLNTHTNENIIDLDKLRIKLINSRNKRIPPFKDKKIITAWNGMVITGLMNKYFSNSQHKYLEKAKKTANYIYSYINKNNELPRYVINDNPFYPATLEDYAYFIEGLIEIHKGTLDYKWLDLAIELSDKVLQLYYDDFSHIMFDSSKDLKDLFVRPKSIYDNPYSSPFSKITECLYYLGSITNNNNYLQIVDRITKDILSYIKNVPMHTLSWTRLLESIKYDQKNHLVIIHENKDIDLLLKTLEINNNPNLFYFGKSIESDSNLEIFNDKKLIENKNTFYLCKSYTCNLPTNSISEIKSQIKNM